MIYQTTGPYLRDVIQRRCFEPGEPGFARYKYADNKGHVVPEYAASRIRIVAAYYRMNPDLLDGLAAKVRAIPGCLSAEKQTGGDRRPRIVADFDRSVLP